MEKNLKTTLRSFARKAWHIFKAILIWTIVFLTLGTIIGGISDLFRGRK